MIIGADPYSRNGQTLRRGLLTSRASANAMRCRQEHTTATLPRNITRDHACSARTIPNCQLCTCD